MPPKGMPEEDSIMDTVIEIIVQNALTAGVKFMFQSIHRSSSSWVEPSLKVNPIEVIPENVFFNLYYSIQVFEGGSYTFQKDIL